MAAREASKNFLFKKFGRLLIVEDLGLSEFTRKRRVIAVCECGIYKEYHVASIKHGFTKSCGCIKVEQFYDVVGNKYGSLTVLDELMRRNNKRMVLVRCKCGNKTMASLTGLETGNTKSCGCVGRRKAGDFFRTHGLSKHLLYGTWGNIKSRCCNPNTSEYENYGGRGICICDEWLNDFVSFYNWCIENGWEKGLSVDRIDNNGHYEPSNCRITNLEVQSRNKRNNIYLEMDGRRMVVADWAKELNIGFTTITQRLKMGLDIHQVLSSERLKWGSSIVPKKEYSQKKQS